MGDAYFGFYLLAMGSGQARTPDANWRALLREAGFAAVRASCPPALPLQTRVDRSQGLECAASLKRSNRFSLTHRSVGLGLP
jgi:hypothetical protein